MLDILCWQSVDKMKKKNNNANSKISPFLKTCFKIRQQNYIGRSNFVENFHRSWKILKQSSFKKNEKF